MGITVICWLIGYHLSNWQGKCVYTVRPLFVTTSDKWQPPIRGYLSVQNTKIFSSQILIIRTSYKQPPLMSLRVQLFWERLSEKMCAQQSRKVIWDMINTLFLDTVAVEPTFVCVALLLTNIPSMVSRAILSNFFE